MSAASLVALSLGAGVQSTTLALLAVEGVLPYRGGADGSHYPRIQ